MKKILLYNMLAFAVVIFCNKETAAQVSVHIGGVIGGGPTPAYPRHAVYQDYAAKLPPGQAKKLYGTKSAKYFAPGQAKKAGHGIRRRYYDDKRGPRVYPTSYPDVYEAPRKPRVIIDAHVGF